MPIDFPDSPSSGDRYLDWTYSTSKGTWLRKTKRSENVVPDTVTFTFDANTEGWTTINASVDIFGPNTAVKRTGAGSALISPAVANAVGGYGIFIAYIQNVQPNVRYGFSGWAENPSGLASSNVAARIYEYSDTAGTTEVSNTTSANTTATNAEWRQFFVAHTFSSAVQNAAVAVLIEPTAGANVHVDDLEFKKATYGTNYLTYNDFLDTTYFPEATGASRSGDPANAIVTSTTTGYKYHVFTASGDLTVTKAGIFEALFVGGGGGGGTHGGTGQAGGGGGGGGVLNVQRMYLDVGTYTITVGGGGAGAPNVSSRYASRGTDTGIGSILAIGGAPGGSVDDTGGGSSQCVGGSGGGGYSLSARPGRIGTPGQGNNGGAGNNGAGGGGGGGAGAVGSNSPGSNLGGDGGRGTTDYDTWGQVVLIGAASGGVRYFGAGGGGGGDNTGGAGGVDGGGDGATGTASGTNGSLSGGGGGGAEQGPGGAGGSGLALIRYRI